MAGGNCCKAKIDSKLSWMKNRKWKKRKEKMNKKPKNVKRYREYDAIYLMQYFWESSNIDFFMKLEITVFGPTVNERFPNFIGLEF